MTGPYTVSGVSYPADSFLTVHLIVLQADPVSFGPPIAYAWIQHIGFPAPSRASQDQLRHFGVVILQPSYHIFVEECYILNTTWKKFEADCRRRRILSLILSKQLNTSDFCWMGANKGLGLPETLTASDLWSNIGAVAYRCRLCL